MSEELEESGDERKNKRWMKSRKEEGAQKGRVWAKVRK
jgi:hypothetical protein